MSEATKRKGSPVREEKATKAPRTAEEEDKKDDAVSENLTQDGQAQAVKQALLGQTNPKMPPEIAQLSAEYSATTIIDVYEECRRYLGYELCPGATDEEIKEVEEKCGFALPEELKELLKYTNGPDPPKKERGLRPFSVKWIKKGAKTTDYGAKVVILYQCNAYQLILDAESGRIYVNYDIGCNTEISAWAPSLMALYQGMLSSYKEMSTDPGLEDDEDEDEDGDPEKEALYDECRAVEMWDDLIREMHLHDFSKDTLEFSRRYQGYSALDL